jgi:hypothetical protein
MCIAHKDKLNRGLSGHEDPQHFVSFPPMLTAEINAGSEN